MLRSLSPQDLDPHAQGLSLLARLGFEPLRPLRGFFKGDNLGGVICAAPQFFSHGYRIYALLADRALFRGKGYCCSCEPGELACPP